jgi:hypothetical protein
MTDAKTRKRKPAPPAGRAGDRQKDPAGRAGDRRKDPADWGPNPIGAAKLMPPPLENLMARGLISIEQYDSAKEIERVFHWVTSGLKSRMSDLARGRGTGMAGSDPLLAAYIGRYRPWADELSRCRTAAPDLADLKRVLHSVAAADLPWLAGRAAERPPPRGGHHERPPRRGGHHPKTLQFVIEFVIDDHTIEAIAKRERHDHRTVKRALLDGLTRYAEIAGWIACAA